MGLFGSSKKKKELKEAKQQLKQLDKRKHHKMMSSSSVDPAKALNEAQPWQVNQEKTTQSLSTLAHKDAWGNSIKEPDLTNPTRSRWERPLDTIRGFQDSIDRGYRRSYYGEDHGPSSSLPDNQPNWGPHRAHNRHVDGSNDGYYTHQPNRMGHSGTPLSASSEEAQSNFGVGAMNSRNGMNEHMIMGNRARNYSNGSTNGGYPDTGYGSVDHGSRGGSSGNLEQDMVYGGQGHSGVPLGAPPTASPFHQISSPPPPPHPQDKPRTVIKLSGGPTNGSTPSPAPPPMQQEEKRKNWLGRRFSRN